jgi:hypothetical protein
MNTNHLIFALAAFVGNCAFAQEVSVTEPGSLSSMITNKETNSLTVSGQINALDLYFIGGELSSLSSLDLSNAQIVAYNGAELYGNASYAANLIPASSFIGSSISSITFPSSGTISIGDVAFAGSKLAALSLPDNVANVGQAAFADCTALASVSLSAKNVLDSYVFSGCSALVSADLGGSSTVYDQEFIHCSSLKTITNAESVSSIGNYAFAGCTSLTEYPFSTSLTSIGEGAFLGTSLAKVDLSEQSKLKSIGANAFSQNTSLSSVVFNSEQSVSIGEGAFLGCTALSSITLPALSEIADYLLDSTSSVSKIVVPSTVSYIGDNAMANMTGLSSVNVKSLSSVPSLGEEVWRNVAQSYVELETSKDDAEDYRAAEQWKEFKISSVTTVSDVAFANETSVKGRFDGFDLKIVATGSNIASVSLFDPAGQTLTAFDTDSDSISINTAQYQNRIFIVYVTLSNGNKASIKLIRK